MSDSEDFVTRYIRGLQMNHGLIVDGMAGPQLLSVLTVKDLRDMPLEVYAALYYDHGGPSGGVYARGGTANGESPWHYCTKCQALYYQSEHPTSPCPAGTGYHNIRPAIDTNPVISKWRAAREAYISGDDDALEEMLSYVHPGVEGYDDV